MLSPQKNEENDMRTVMFTFLSAILLAQPAVEDAAQIRRRERHQAHQLQLMETQGWLRHAQETVARVERDLKEAPEPVRKLLKEKLRIHQKQEEAIRDKITAHEKEATEKVRKAVRQLEELERALPPISLALEEIHTLEEVRRMAAMAGIEAEAAPMLEELKAGFARQQELRKAIAELRKEEAAIRWERETIFSNLDKRIEKKGG
jgi:dynactin complex subunit